MADENKPEGGVSPESGSSAKSPEAKPSEAAPPAAPDARAAAAEKPAATESAAPAKKPAPPAKKPAPPKAPAVMEVEPWEGPIAGGLQRRFSEAIRECSVYRGQPFAVADLSSVIPILEYLKLEEDFDYLVDITAVDYPKKEARFEVIWILYSFQKNLRIRIKAAAGEGEKPRTAVEVYPTANWLEREIFDMFGVEFEDHPNMTRILMPDGWQGHPLRKDYPILQQDADWVRENLHIESAQ